MEFESIKENGEKSDKEEKWRQIEQEVEGIKDKKGKGIDEKIKSSVIALKVNGFSTTASCEGHLDWGLPWPWIDVESSLTEKLLNDGRYNKLKEKYRATRKEGKEISEEEKQEYQKFISAQIEENEKEYQRLAGLLEKFYESSPKKVSENFIPLAIKKGPWNQSRIQPLDVPKRGKPQEIQKLWADEEKTEKLTLYRQEMKRFTEFLRHKFFNAEI